MGRQDADDAGWLTGNLPSAPARRSPPPGKRDVDGPNEPEADVQSSSQVIPAITLPTVAVAQRRQSPTPGVDAQSASLLRKRVTAQPLATQRERSWRPQWDDLDLDATAFGAQTDTRLVAAPGGLGAPAPRRTPLRNDEKRSKVVPFGQRDRSGAVVVPSQGARSLPSTPLQRGLARAIVVAGTLRRRPLAMSAILLATVLVALLLNMTGAAQNAGALTNSAWRALAGMSAFAEPPPPPAAPQSLDPQHFMNTYGFDQPVDVSAIGGDERDRLVTMLPYAMKATAAFDARYHKAIEPQLVVFWTHAEGIRGRVNYSNCANQSPPGGYFQVIQNCNHANFWQLGYGNQFSVIYILKNAFTDLYGNPNDTQAVQRVGQSVLDFDRKMGTTPLCGGYSCTFPAKTIDQIMSDVNLTTGAVTEGNWWASVLSRDPAINSYMIAHALTFFNHQATARWVGCYYAEPCWQRISNRLGDVLVSWPDLSKAAGIKS